MKKSNYKSFSLKIRRKKNTKLSEKNIIVKTNVLSEYSRCNNS